MAKKEKGQKLTYFLDHPQIKRQESLGNGNSPGSIAEKINWGGKNTPEQNAAIKAQQPKQPTQASSSGSSSDSSSSSGVMSAIKGLFKK